MTRETKVGLVVSCSFLCLVGTVVYVKYTQGDLPSQTTYANADSGALTIPADPAPAPTTGPDTLAALTGEEGKESPVLTVPPYTPPSMVDPNIQRTASAENRPSDTSATPIFPETIPTPSSRPGTAADATAKDASRDDKQPAPPTWEATGASRVGNDQTQTPAFTAPNGDTAKITPPSAPPGAANPAPFPSPPPPESAPGTKTEAAPQSNQAPTFAPLPEPANTTTETKPEPVKETRAPVFTPASTNPTTSPAPFPPPPTPAGGDTPATSSPLTTSDTKPFPPPPAPAGVEPTTSPPSPSPPNDAASQPTPAPTPVGNGSFPPTGNQVQPPPESPQPKLDPVPATPETNVRLNPPVANSRPDQPAATAGAANWDRNPRALPPVGATGSVTSPPIAVPVPPSSTGGRTTSNFVPQVESYDEETYPCRTGDTLEAISQRYYNSDKYARALLLFNRNHPRPATGLTKEPPLVIDGQPVYIPPPHILEKYYAYALPTSKTPPAVVIPATGTTQGTAPSAAPRSGPRYIVRQAEMVSAVARNTLGNLERWSEIYELNGRGFDPSRPIPAGTVLTMPADARVPDANLQ